jgi:dephospho-CoA kinase
LPVLGLVGGIGAGKSRVSELLAARGALVLDADRVGHALLDQRPARDLVLERFGPEVAIPADPAETPEGEGEGDTTPAETRIDRARLGAIVFADPGARRALERILHPRMRGTFEKAIGRAARRRRSPLVVLDAAILYEAGWDDLCDMVAFVDAPDEVRRSRVAATRGWSAADLKARESAQMPLDTKKGRADLVIPNGGTPEALESQIAKLWSGRLHLGKAGTGRSGPRPAARPSSRPAETETRTRTDGTTPNVPPPAPAPDDVATPRS